MSQRKPSGEIVNATLLEVFLSFVFVVLAIAWFRSAQLQEVEAANDDLRAKTDSLELALSRLITQNDSLRKRLGSDKPDDCRKGYVLTFALTAPTSWTVTAHQDGFGYRSGEVFTVASSTIRAQMTEFIESSFGRKPPCRFRVRILDTDGVGKREYQAAVNRIAGIFYVGGG